MHLCGEKNGKKQRKTSTYCFVNVDKLNERGTKEDRVGKKRQRKQETPRTGEKLVGESQVNKRGAHICVYIYIYIHIYIIYMYT